ncbi:bifunctional 4-hydroxy-2-oxoglutarate aldolase/2-dehydro-3-deoxy-phosphogluconate aldolase [Parapedobacter indicus]|uniref:2-dehydro-3-deoxyphosphogluconate aldolase / (4S)-4-hydroxy-2-oxoglutarate aldolase n=1 Tax=Parapedobacter indicus TaxID=1477437 RepID=A0A1I3FE04_9SPHI|nr:bifunctional 4-hydroxy-2-oxoglutarate aldolase/2-dehydro-3-deoxy-phosphogluconate aldolase [Parapedobacter indicus]PPL03673.1 2-dehydro-3-deoxyphosphogluconate aldolase/(4S)-4-hydroxy-2-oxoglutarate aldolase [Parapedobacter indicus]SFI09332.1 2-dehydro-3-deoxyphosphogluconate aldolase / (4S)-4-hydroxy-2-oxoglutarate aldolase [Parapedobacter indicus]
MKGFDVTRFRELPIIGILRNISFAEVMELLPLCAEAGLYAVEITLNSADAPRIIEEAQRRYGSILCIGAGTVCNLPDLHVAKEAGACFIVTPIMEPDVITACVSENLAVFPGAMTPTEVAIAWKLGATQVKLFPAGRLGSDYVRDISAPLAHIPLLATGGIHRGQMEDYWSAGANGFGFGSPLFPPSLIVNKEWGLTAVHIHEYVTTLQHVMSGSKKKGEIG